MGIGKRFCLHDLNFTYLQVPVDGSYTVGAGGSLAGAALQVAHGALVGVTVALLVDAGTGIGPTQLAQLVPSLTSHTASRDALTWTLTP